MAGLLWLALLLLAWVGCSASSVPVDPATPGRYVARSSDLEALTLANPLRPLPEIPRGLGTNFATTKLPPRPEGVRLGRWLFFDPRVSRNGETACGDCHRPSHGFSSPGVSGGRQAPPLLNLAWTAYPSFGWDGRANSLEAMIAPEEDGTHGISIEGVARSSTYRVFFEGAFGSPAITEERIAASLADYVRTLLSGDSPFDRHYSQDPFVLQRSAQRGYELFLGKAGCAVCHTGQSFTDASFHNLGVGWNESEGRFRDPGRYRVSRRPRDLGAFKTPGLRDVSRRGPYMHDGSLPTLVDVIRFYDSGARPNPGLSPRLRPLGLSSWEREDLLAFLLSLESRGRSEAAPSLFPD